MSSINRKSSSGKLKHSRKRGGGNGIWAIWGQQKDILTFISREHWNSHNSQSDTSADDNLDLQTLSAASGECLALSKVSLLIYESMNLPGRRSCLQHSVLLQIMTGLWKPRILPNNNIIFNQKFPSFFFFFGVLNLKLRPEKNAVQTTLVLSSVSQKYRTEVSAATWLVKTELFFFLILICIKVCWCFEKNKKKTVCLRI